MNTEKVKRIAGSGGLAWAVAAGLSLLASAPVLAQESNLPGFSGPDVFKTSYFDVATSASPSRAGYGGVGMSGGAGENTVRLINTTQANSVAEGTLCAMIYVFDDFEELQTCCGCPITPDGLRTISTVNDLTTDFGVNKANLNAGVIEVVSSQPNFSPTVGGNVIPPGPNPPGTNGVCSPTGKKSNDPFGRSTAIVPTSGLRGYITHDEFLEPGNITSASAIQGASVDEFEDSPLDSTHLTALQTKCEQLIANGSGAGICKCGVGENSPATASTASR